MKIRGGFVSNSSSSSFIVAFRGTETVPDTDEIMKKYFKAEEGTLQYKLLYEFADYLGSESRYSLDTIEKILDNYGYKTVEEMEEDGGYYYESLIKLIKRIRADDEKWAIKYDLASYNETDDPAELFFGMGGVGDFDGSDIVIISDSN